MTNSTTEKTPNYTDAMVQRLKDEAPLDLEKAKMLAAEFGGGKTYKSVIAKAKREGIEYIVQAPATKKGKDAPTKAQLVTAMADASGLKLLQLEKAPVATINELAHFFERVLGIDDTNESEEGHSQEC